MTNLQRAKMDWYKNRKSFGKPRTVGVDRKKEGDEDAEKKERK